MVCDNRRLILCGDRRSSISATGRGIGWQRQSVGHTRSRLLGPHLGLEVAPHGVLPADRRWALFDCAGPRRLPLTGILVTGWVYARWPRHQGLCPAGVGRLRSPGLGVRTATKSVVPLVRRRTLLVGNGRRLVVHGPGAGDRRFVICTRGQGIGWWHQSVRNTGLWLGIAPRSALPAGGRKSLSG